MPGARYSAEAMRPLESPRAASSSTSSSLAESTPSKPPSARSIIALGIPTTALPPSGSSTAALTAATR